MTTLTAPVKGAKSKDIPKNTNNPYPASLSEAIEAFVDYEDRGGEISGVPELVRQSVVQSIESPFGSLNDLNDPNSTLSLFKAVADRAVGLVIVSGIQNNHTRNAIRTNIKDTAGRIAGNYKKSMKLQWELA